MKRFVLKKGLKVILLISLISVLFISCSNTNYISKNEEILDIDSIPFEDVKLTLDDLKINYLTRDKLDQLVSYLSILSYKTQKYSAYINFIISDLYYTNTNSKDLALYYMAKVDPVVYQESYNDQKIGYTIALRIINGEANFFLKERMYLLLLNDFDSLIDTTYTLNELSKLYKSNLEIKKAIKVMEKIVELTNINKNSEENINLSEIKRDIDFYSKKSWINRDLGKLIENIKSAVIEQNSYKLYQFASKNNFQVVLSQNFKDHKWTYSDIGIQYRFSNRIIFSNKLEDFSNDKEAFLKTENWNFPLMTTWYFYFKKVHYPYDDKINGGWEWKGIYFGDYF